MNEAFVSIITINYRQAQITCDLLDSLADIHYAHYETLLVDNGMEQDATSRYQQHLPTVKVINSAQNLGFAGANNLAIQQAKGDYILLLNNDTIVPKHFLAPMVALMEKRPEVGILSPKIYYYDQPNTLQYAGTARIDLTTGRGTDPAKLSEDQGQYQENKAVELAHGACMLIRKEVLEDIGLLSEDYFLYYEELDFCMRARQAGWQIYYTADSYIHHRESSSTGKSSAFKTYYMFRNRWLFMKKFNSTFHFLQFACYFLCISLPLNSLRFVWQKEWKHLQALWQGLVWNLSGQSNAQGNIQNLITP